MLWAKEQTHKGNKRNPKPSVISRKFIRIIVGVRVNVLLDGAVEPVNVEPQSLE